jgi:RNA polymerase sigma-70 factor (ECF subfamily)
MKLVERLCLANSQRKRIAGARQRLFRAALAWCGDDMLADDLVQETLALGLQKVHQLRDPERLDPWLYSILNNCWKQYLRSKRYHDELDAQRPCESLPLEAAAGRLETVTRVREAVAALPLEQRQVLSLVDLEGFAYCEVARILGIPIGTVMSRLHRGRKSLLRALEAKETGGCANTASLRRVK